ncbi:hypothetical protein BJY01DRAFT_244160 [Aspergillus pseudoustus]|uniref:Uncharacterized protein n=1 Tax=Aspergillus pseudoustus TaxID=1810923 RepID=A0ABR4KM64_9EURO
MPTGKPNPNLHSDNPEGFTEHFNENVDYTRDKSQAEGKAATGGQSQWHQGLRSTTLNPTADSFGEQEEPAKQVSIDSTNAGVDHSKSSYHFTAAGLSHPSDRAGPEE